MRRSLATVAVAALLVTAGCGALFDGGSEPATGTPPESPSQPSPDAPSTDTEPATPTEPAGPVTVRGDELPVNATLVYERVQQLLGVDGPSVQVTVAELNEPADLNPNPRPFVRRLGLAGGTVDGRPVVGLTDGERVTIRVTDEASAAAIEQELVHQFVHVIQQTRYERANRTGRTVFAVTEGTAMFVTDRYVNDYRPESTGPVTRGQIRFSNRSLPFTVRLFEAQAYFGARYTDRVVNDTSEVRSVYEEPPATAEQLLDPTTDDEPVALPVRDDVRPRAAFLSSGRTYGELFVYTALSHHLPRDRARTASDGWGNDRLYRVTNRSASANVWVTRWDTPRDADQFHDAMREYVARVDGFGTDDRHVSVTRHANRTVVVRVGNAMFVNATTTSVAPDGTVTVRLNETAAADLDGSLDPNGLTESTVHLTTRSSLHAVTRFAG